MDEELKKKLSKIEKRLDEIEEFLGEIPSFEKTTHYEIGDEVDELYDNAVWVVIQHEKCSASLLQRRLQVEYSRAVRILEQLEKNGIVSKSDGSKPRDVLIKQEDIELLKTKLDEKFETLSDEKKKKSN